MVKITAKDVATLAGVDPSAVSRVLNQATKNHRYSAETIDKIKSAAAELGYQPSMAAKALRTGKSMLIGMVVPDIGNPFFAKLASYVEQLAWQDGYRVVVSSSNEDAIRQMNQVKDLISRGIDGLIVSPAIGGEIPPFGAVVAIDRPAEAGDIPCVCLDNHKAGFLLGNYLASQGYHDIGVVLQDFQLDPTIRQRFDGFVEGMGDANILWQLEMPFGSEMIESVKYETLAKLKKSPQPDAVIGLSNWCTLGALEAMAELGIQWGNEIGLGGVDDFAGAGLMKPGITVVAQPIKKLAEQAYTNLFDLINGNEEKASASQILLLEPVLIVRESLPGK